MGLEQIVPAIALIAVLILVLPNFLRSNSEKKQLFKNTPQCSFTTLSPLVSYVFHQHNLISPVWAGDSKASNWVSANGKRNNRHTASCSAFCLDASFG